MNEPLINDVEADVYIRLPEEQENRTTTNEFNNNNFQSFNVSNTTQPATSRTSSAIQPNKHVARFIGLVVIVLVFVGLVSVSNSATKMPTFVSEESKSLAPTRDTTEFPSSFSPTQSANSIDPMPTASPSPPRLFDFSEARKVVNEQRKMLEVYYAPSHVMNSSWAFEAGSEKWMQSQNFLAKKIAAALVNKRWFVTGGIGGSVLAGHDNCNFDSFPSQMERLMKPLFVAAGSDYEFRNGGVRGDWGDDMDNGIFCAGSTVGADIDALVYGWSYHEHHEQESTHESIIRWSLMNQRQPPVHFLYPTGGQTNKRCMFKNKRDEQILNTYDTFGVNAFCLRQALEMIPGYSHRRGGWGAVGDGLHQTTRYGLTDESGARSKSLGVVWRNWLPGPLGFQLTADSFGYLYMDAMLVAFDMVEQESESNVYAVFEDVETGPVMGQMDLPHPLFCGDSDLPCELERAPLCTTFGQPRFGIPGVQLANDYDKLNPFKFNPCHISHSDDQDNIISKWELQLPDPSSKVPRDEHMYTDKCESLDSLGFYTNNKNSNPHCTDYIAFKLPVLEISGVVLCCASRNCAEKQFRSENMAVYLRSETDRNGSIEERVDMEIHASDWLVGFPNSKCARVLAAWPKGVSTRHGQSLYLGVNVGDGDLPDVTIAQVIVY